MWLLQNDGNHGAQRLFVGMKIEVYMQALYCGVVVAKLLCLMFLSLFHCSVPSVGTLNQAKVPNPSEGSALAF